MRILHFYKKYVTHSYGGVEQLIFQLVNGMTAQGISSDVLSLSANKNPTTVEMNGHKAHTVHCDFEVASTGFSLSAFSAFKKLARQADIIHYHFPWPFMDLVHLATRVKTPSVVTYHSDIIKQKNLLRLYRPLMMSFLGKVDRIVATSPNYLESSEVLTAFKDKVSVVPIGLDKNSYATPSTARLEFWQQRFDGQFFLFVGMLRYYKGLNFLIEAVEHLKCPIVIVGSGPEEERLKQQIANTGIKHVHFVGAINDEDKSALFTLCYGFVFPSHVRSEAFGISLLEAAMYGKPLISCEIGTGTSFINQHNETGLVVPPEDPFALKDALELLWNNPDLASTLGAGANKRYQELFTLDKMTAGYLQIYQQILNR